MESGKTNEDTKEPEIGEKANGICLWILSFHKHPLSAYTRQWKGWPWVARIRLPSNLEVRTSAKGGMGSLGTCLNDSPWAHPAKMPIRTLQVVLG